MPTPTLATLEPMLLSERRRPFSDPGWAFEVKHDGWRILAAVDGGACELKTRNGTVATTWFAEAAAGLSTLPGGPHVLDGEMCVLDELGRSDFDRLQARARRRGRRRGDDAVVFCAFDLLVLDGRNMMRRALQERKTALKQLLASKPDSVLYISGIDGNGTGLYELAVGLELEGIVAKRLRSKYQPGERSSDWIKIVRPGHKTPGSFKRNPSQ